VSDEVADPWAVEACDGSVSCRNRDPDGLAVTMTLPLTIDGPAGR
jgi:hypothetical protein